MSGPLQVAPSACCDSAAACLDSELGEAWPEAEGQAYLGSQPGGASSHQSALAPAVAALSRRLRTVRRPGTLAADAAGLGPAGRPDAAYQLLQHGLQLLERQSEVSTESKSTEPRNGILLESARFGKNSQASRGFAEAVGARAKRCGIGAR